MNSSQNKGQNKSSPGFIYFNPHFQKPNTQDYLSFEESPNSSFYNNYERQPSPQYGSPTFHSSPRKFNNGNTYRYSGGNRGNRSFHSPNNSFNRSWNNQRSPHQRQNFNRVPMMSKDGSRDMSMFYDTTCTQNPWEELEKEFEKEQATNMLESKDHSEIKETESKKTKEKGEDICSGSEDEENNSSASSSSTSNSDSNSDGEAEEKT